MRDRDPHIPPSEPLFHGLEEGCWNGDEVLVDAIDSGPWSCFRSKYASLADVYARFAGAAEITGERLPPPATHNAVTWTFFTIDDPTPTFDAHCEIRMRRATDSDETHRKPGSSPAKEELRRSLAARMRLAGTRDHAGSLGAVDVGRDAPADHLDEDGEHEIEDAEG